MIKSYLFAFCLFAFIFIVFFVGGILGVVFSIKGYKNIRELEKSSAVESAVITKFQMRIRSRGFSNSIYFTTRSDGKSYHYNILKLLPGKIEAGDDIEVKFNENRTLFLITNYSSAFYADYIIRIFLFIVCIILSMFCLYDAISIYKYM